MCSLLSYKKIYIITRGGFRGGGGFRRTPSQGFDPLPTQLFKKSTFGRPTLKFFQRRIRRQYLLILRGERAPKKRIFLIKTFQKLPKNACFDCFFKNLPPAQNILPKCAKQCSGRAQKINLVDLKKGQISNFF